MTSTQTPPPAATECDIYPVHFFDDNETNRKKTMSWTMRFNDILDAEKIHDSLCRLLEIGDWRKLAGHLRHTKNGKLEIHTPKEFTPENPAVSYSHDALPDMSISEHPLASKLPKATDGPSIRTFDGHFRELAGPPGLAGNVEELISKDAPQMALHITSFSDATLVTISWPHTLMDAIGHQDLLRSWSLVVAGREEEVPPLLGAVNDVLLEAEQSNPDKAEEFKMKERQLGGVGTSVFFSRYMWDNLRNGAVETRLIYIPKKVFAKIRNQAQEEAVAAAQSIDEKPYVGEGDAMIAWISRTMALAEKKSRPLTVASLYNARFRLSSLANQTGVYIQNMVLFTFTFLPGKMAKGPLGPTAMCHRRHLVEQATEEQSLSFLRIVRDLDGKGKGKATMFGEKDALPLIINNLTKVDLIKVVDFSGAVIRQGEKDESRSNPVGGMVNYHFQHFDELMTIRNFFAVMGKDYDDSYWITAALFPKSWDKFEEELKKLA
ncbi:hypothetical protein G7Z17_g8139 [Cylindrodendrum hubeiense]|uniref:Uncharacterized protein n=1 Tax=Cylindrodendrum hubeiense TaxID=595255 RepID=A0A9P5H7N4_9HYPO|nr:hypothetical protein G7Z17_g8139 [Cylindrodendrum hubeiense]